MKMKAKLFLRIGLGLTYIYSGIGLLRNPIDWAHFMPEWLMDLFGAPELALKFLQVQGIGELLLGLLILIWNPKPKIYFWLAAFGAVHVALILIFSGIDLVTFRDIGLLGAWLALAALTHEEAKPQN